MHIIIFSDIAALDGLDDIPLKSVDVVGVAETLGAAVQMVDRHFHSKPDLATTFRDNSSMLVPNPQADRERDLRNTLWFLPDPTPGKEEIHAGYGETTLYRIVNG